MRVSGFEIVHENKRLVSGFLATNYTQFRRRSSRRFLKVRNSTYGGQNSDRRYYGAVQWGLNLWANYLRENVIRRKYIIIICTRGAVPPSDIKGRHSQEGRRRGSSSPALKRRKGGEGTWPRVVSCRVVCVYWSAAANYKRWPDSSFVNH